MPSNKKKTKGKQKRQPPTVSADTPASLIAGQVEEAQQPTSQFLYDPGNGLRVTNVKIFLQSSLAQPVSKEEEIEVFGEQAILEILETLLPKDIALVHCRLSKISNTN